MNPYVQNNPSLQNALKKAKKKVKKEAKQVAKKEAKKETKKEHEKLIHQGRNNKKRKKKNKNRKKGNIFDIGEEHAIDAANQLRKHQKNPFKYPPPRSLGSTGRPSMLIYSYKRIPIAMNATIDTGAAKNYTQLFVSVGPGNITNTSAPTPSPPVDTVIEVGQSTSSTMPFGDPTDGRRVGFSWQNGAVINGIFTSASQYRGVSAAMRIHIRQGMQPTPPQVICYQTANATSIVNANLSAAIDYMNSPNSVEVDACCVAMSWLPELSAMGYSNVNQGFNGRVPFIVVSGLDPSAVVWAEFISYCEVFQNPANNQLGALFSPPVKYSLDMFLQAYSSLGPCLTCFRVGNNMKDLGQYYNSKIFGMVRELNYSLPSVNVTPNTGIFQSPEEKIQDELQIQQQAQNFSGVNFLSLDEQWKKNIGNKHWGSNEQLINKYPLSSWEKLFHYLLAPTIIGQMAYDEWIIRERFKQSKNDYELSKEKGFHYPYRYGHPVHTIALISKPIENEELDNYLKQIKKLDNKEIESDLDSDFPLNTDGELDLPLNSVEIALKEASDASTDKEIKSKIETYLAKIIGKDKN